MNIAIFTDSEAVLKEILNFVCESYLVDDIERSIKSICVLNSIVSTDYIDIISQKNYYEKIVVVVHNYNNSSEEYQDVFKYSESVSILNMEKFIESYSFLEKDNSKSLSGHVHELPQSLDYIEKLLLMIREKTTLHYEKIALHKELQLSYQSNSSLEEQINGCFRKIEWLRKRKEVALVEKAKSDKALLKCLKSKLKTEVRLSYKLLENPSSISKKIISKKRKVSNLDYFLLQNSTLFDAKWYLQVYEDVQLKSLDPIIHYLQFGWKENRDPSKYFSTREYLDKNQDVKKAQINPLLHFLNYGLLEDRNIDWGKLCLEI